ncbi:MAG: pyridoxamine 5'-phosphate oxidase family protein [Burkholderiales bacterium]|nr:pyridoxamine 5'-phosphate oxidase family protein [Burkholderiales bacterium]
MTLALPPPVRDYLAAQHVMTLATQGADGPWAAAVFYAQLGDDFVFVSSPASRHAGHLAQDARCAAAIHGAADDWASIRGAQLEGRIEPLQGDAAREARERYGAKFPFARPAVAAAPILAALARVHWYRLRVERLFFIDNAQGFGKRQVFVAQA